MPSRGCVRPKVGGRGCARSVRTWMGGGGRTVTVGGPVGRDEVVVEFSAPCWSSLVKYLWQGILGNDRRAARRAQHVQNSVCEISPR